MASKDRFYCIKLSLMGIQFEKLKKKNPTDRPILVKQGRVRGNTNIFKVGLKQFSHHSGEVGGGGGGGDRVCAVAQIHPKESITKIAR